MASLVRPILLGRRRTVLGMLQSVIEEESVDGVQELTVLIRNILLHGQPLVTAMSPALVGSWTSQDGLKSSLMHLPSQRASMLQCSRRLVLIEDAIEPRGAHGQLWSHDAEVPDEGPRRSCSSCHFFLISRKSSGAFTIMKTKVRVVLHSTLHQPPQNGCSTIFLDCLLCKISVNALLKLHFLLVKEHIPEVHREAYDDWAIDGGLLYLREARKPLFGENWQGSQ